MAAADTTNTGAPEPATEPPGPWVRVAKALGVVTTIAMVGTIGFVAGRTVGTDPQAAPEDAPPADTAFDQHAAPGTLLGIGHYCIGGVPMDTEEVLGFDKATLDWAIGDSFGGQFTATNEMSRPLTISDIRLDWPGHEGFELSLQTQLLSEAQAADGCIPLPEEPDAEFPITLAPDQTRTLRYTITMGRCAELGPYVVIGSSTPLLQAVVDTAAGPVAIAAGPFDEIAFSGDSDCSSSGTT